MNEYKITRQPADAEWAAVEGAPAGEMDLHPPHGEDWTLHSFANSSSQILVVWQRPKRTHAMSEVYSHAGGSEATGAEPVKTIAAMPEPNPR